MRLPQHTLLRRLWLDEAGGVNSAELMLIMTLLCVGMLVGIKSMRDATVTEFADMAQALANLDQSYSFPGIAPTPANNQTSTASSSFVDTLDFCDTSGDTDTGTAGSKCVNVCIAATSE